MTKLIAPAVPGWPDITRFEVVERLLGGDGGPLNRAPLELLERTEYLKKQIDDAVSGALTLMYANRLKTARNITMTGDGSWTVAFDGNGNVTAAMTLANSGVGAGTYAVVTVDGKGRVTAARQLQSADLPVSAALAGQPTCPTPAPGTNDQQIVNAEFVQAAIGANPAQSSFRNKIINGRMDIAQRGTSFAAIASGAYSADRWGFANTSAAVLTASQQASGPNYEFPSALRLAVTTADAVIAAGDQSTVGQVIEGYNVRDLIGKDFILGFWVKSPKTGKHCVSFRNSGTDRSFVAEYNVNAANTYEFKTVTVAGGLLTVGTWDWASGAGLRVSWVLAAGSTYQTAAGAWQTGNFLATANQVNCLDTVGNTFEITGVQLEAGLTATPFEHRAHGQEIALAQRYYETSAGTTLAVKGAADGYASVSVFYAAEKRSSATLTPSAGSGLNQSTRGATVNYNTGGSANSTVLSWTANAEIAYV